MGADIHLYVEKRPIRETVVSTSEGITVVPHAQGEAGAWVSADRIVPNSWRERLLKEYLTPGGEHYDPDPATLLGYQQEYDSMEEFEVSYGDRFYSGRNYALFSLLADVRSDDDADPIMPPRGLPDDVSDFVQAESDGWDIDGHSHSYFTLGELLEVDWYSDSHQYTGVIDAQSYDRLDKHNIPPEQWSGSIAGPNIVTLTEKQMQDRIAAGDIFGFYNRDAWMAKHPGQELPQSPGGWLGGGAPEPDGKTYYVQTTWKVPKARAASDFMDTIVKLAQLAHQEGLGFDDVRITFWFDN